VLEANANANAVLVVVVVVEAIDKITLLDKVHHVKYDSTYRCKRWKCSMLGSQISPGHCRSNLWRVIGHRNWSCRNRRWRNRRVKNRRWRGLPIISSLLVDVCCHLKE
jgi:hypothetical protein